MQGSWVQGWFREGFFLWPLWCPTDPPCPLHCISTLRFLPFVAIHLLIFYFSALFIHILRKKNKWPDHTGFDGGFNNTFYVASHVPMIVMGFPLCLMAMTAGRDVWMPGDRFIEYGLISNPLVTEVSTWVSVYLVADTFLVVIHRFGSKELYIHHFVFLLGVSVWIGHCCASLTVCILVAQEGSTPWLNLFQLSRAYKGLNSVWTKGAFVVFAVFFYIFRVFLNTFGTVHFCCELVYGFWGTPALPMPRWKAVTMASSLVIASGLQLHWARKIAVKFYRGIRGREV